MKESVVEDKKSRGRIEWLDFVKGTAILLVVLGHLEDAPVSLRAIIFSFHMPLFIIVNGYLIHSYKIGRTLKRSAKTLLIPYVIVCLFQAVFDIWRGVGNDSTGWDIFSLRMKAMLLGMSRSSTILVDVPSIWLVWFVCSLFLIRNIYVFMECYVGNKKQWLVDGIILVLMCLGYYIGCYVAYLPWSFDVVLAALIFIRVGDLLKKSEVLETHTKIIFFVSTAVWGICLYFQLFIDLSMRRYPLFPVTHLEAIAGSLSVIIVCRYLSKINLLQKIFTWYGKNSMLILGIHCLEAMYFDWQNWVYAPLRIPDMWIMHFVIKIIMITSITGMVSWVNQKRRDLFSGKQKVSPE